MTGFSTRRRGSPLLFSALLASSYLSGAWAQELSDAQINVISARMAESALKSWELGTRAQAILELNATAYSVFSNNPLPPPAAVPEELSGPLQPFFDIARDIVREQNVTDGPQPLMPDGSAADPAANGPCILLANWTSAENDSGNDFGGAARRQLEYLLSDAVPKTADGAISHRVNEVQLWNDFVYMVPPFLAYYGALTSNRTLLAQAYDQVRLYREYLRDEKTGMWRHVMLGSSGNDENFWTTGNGWAAAGMLRVHATIQNSEYAGNFKKEQKNLQKWIDEVHNSIYKHLDDTGIFPNYAGQPADAPNNFYDTSGTALVAYSVYRACTHLGQCGNIPFAEASRQALFASNGTEGSSDSFAGFTHFTPEGWLTPVVNPHSYRAQGEKSGEGQAFVVMLHAAYNEWKDAGMKSNALSNLATVPASVALFGIMLVGQMLHLAL